MTSNYQIWEKHGILLGPGRRNRGILRSLFSRALRWFSCARKHVRTHTPFRLCLLFSQLTDVHNRLSTYHALFFSFSTFSWKSLTRYLIFLSQRLFTQHTLPARIESDVQEEESTPLSSKQPLQKLFHPPVPVMSKVRIQCDALIRLQDLSKDEF